MIQRENTEKAFVAGVPLKIYFPLRLIYMNAWKLFEIEN